MYLCVCICVCVFICTFMSRSTYGHWRTTVGVSSYFPCHFETGSGFCPFSRSARFAGPWTSMWFSSPYPICPWRCLHYRCPPPHLAFCEFHGYKFKTSSMCDQYFYTLSYFSETYLCVPWKVLLLIPECLQTIQPNISANSY